MGTPNYPKTMASEWNQLKRDVRNAFTSANLRTGMAKIGAKVIEITGSLILNPGAFFGARYANGANAFVIGQTTYRGSTVGQVIVKRFNGSTALQVFGGESEPGFFSIHDQASNIIVSDDSGNGSGLARPWIPYTVFETKVLTAPKYLNTTTNFDAHYTIAGVMQHPKVKVDVYLHCNGSDVAQWRVKNPETGTILATSGNDTSGWKTLEFKHEAFGFGDAFRYDVEVRRVSGTSTGVGLTIVATHGRQT